MNENWKKISVPGIAKIQKRVAVFDIWEFHYTPYARFQIKIMEDQDGLFSGFTNIGIRDRTGHYCAVVGHGKSIEAALEDTLNCFFMVLAEKQEWEGEDFEYTDPCDW